MASSSPSFGYVATTRPALLIYRVSQTRRIAVPEHFQPRLRAVCGCCWDALQGRAAPGRQPAPVISAMSCAAVACRQ